MADEIVKAGGEERNRNPFEVLGISRELIGKLGDEALREIVATMGRKLSALYHPDSQYHEKNVARFEQVREALEALETSSMFSLYKEQALVDSELWKTKKKSEDLSARIKSLEKEKKFLNEAIESRERLIMLNWMDRFGYHDQKELWPGRTLMLPSKGEYYLLSQLEGSEITVAIPKSMPDMGKIEELEKKIYTVLKDAWIASQAGEELGFRIISGVNSPSQSNLNECLSHPEFSTVPFVIPRSNEPRREGSLLMTKGRSDKRSDISYLGVLLEVKFPTRINPQAKARKIEKLKNG